MERRANNTKYLIVLTILEGRGFQNRPSCKLLIEAKFDGDLLTTDAVAHTTNPFINTELAWEIDVSSLSTAKLQRTPIRINCHMEDSNGTKNSIGYCILDIRAAHQNNKTLKWHGLLGTKYTTKPELKLGLNLEMDKSDVHLKTQKQNKHISSSDKTEFPTQPTNAVLSDPLPSTITTNIPEIGEISKSSVATSPPDRLRPILNDQGAFYQIGPSDKCTRMFNFSVTVGFVSNLHQLKPSTATPTSSAKGFFFYYSLLGNDIMTDVFNDLVTPRFSPERASVKLRSDAQCLRKYFASLPALHVHLCHGESSLGYAEIPVKDLLDNVEGEKLEQPVVTEDAYELKTSRQSQFHKLPLDARPVVGILLCLKLEDEVSKIESTVLKPHDQPISSENLEVDIATIDDDDDEDDDDDRETRARTPPPSQNNFNQPTHSHLSQTPPEKLPKVQLQQSTRDRFAQHAAAQPQSGPRRYLLTLELQSVTDYSISSSINCIIKFSYPPLGKMTPILTHPPVELKPESTISVPNGISKFHFEVAPHLLETNMSTEPLRLELLHYDTVTGENNLIGSGKALLDELFKNENTSVWTECGKPRLRRRWTDTIEIFSAMKTTLLIAKVDVDVTLEDFGAVGTFQDTKPPAKLESNNDPVSDDFASRAALEVEQWKEIQETMFIAKLKEKETQHLQMLTSEWRARERERETLMQMKVSEYQELEDKLAKTLADVERRERQLAANESEVKQAKMDMKLQRERELKQFDDSSRRMREECSHQVEIERKRNMDLQENCQKLRIKVGDLEKKLDTSTTEFRAYREKVQQPELQLQSELKMLQLQKTQLEHKVDALTKSKVHYKQQWGRCLRELARLKKAMQSEAEIQLQQRQKELDELKLQLAVGENKQEVENERRKLMDLKIELEKFHKERIQDDCGRETGPGSVAERKTRLPLVNLTDNDLARLTTERDILLNTGVYTVNDSIIIALDDQIRQLKTFLGQ